MLQKFRVILEVGAFIGLIEKLITPFMCHFVCTPFHQPRAERLVNTGLFDVDNRKLRLWGGG